MGNNNGGSFFVVLLLVAVVFGAGFLLSQDWQAQYNGQVADAALVQATQKNIDKDAEIEKLRAQLAAAEKKAADTATRATAAEARATDAESKASAAETHAADAETRAAAAETRAVDAEAKATVAKTHAADAEIRAAAEKDARINAENEAIDLRSRLTTLAEEHQMLVDAGIGLPVTGGDNQPVTPTAEPQPQSGKMVESWPWLAPGIGVLFFGLLAAVITVGWKMLNNNPRTFAGQAETKAMTYVKMTREEARLYARGRRNIL